MRKTLTSRQLLDNAVTEKELKHNVEQALKLTGWTFFHAFFSEYSPGGYPDETATRRDRTVWMELKTMKGKVSEKQVFWLDALSDNPHNEVFLIRPNMMQLVLDVLSSPAPYQGPERWTRENHFGESVLSLKEARK